MKGLFSFFVCAAFIAAISSAHAESGFDRVIKTNTLRCGYAIATPWFMKDPETGVMSGYGYDVTNRVAEKMGVKVEWAEETGWGVAEQGLMSGRYDMMCGSVCIDPKRARAATYSTPFEHAPILPVVRKGDHRFDKGTLEKLNDPSVKIGVKNGHVFEFIVNEQFPKAQKIYANDISDDSEFLLMLETKKIDIALAGQSTVDLYEKTHPGTVRSLEDAVRYCDGAFMVPLGDFRLKAMVDNALMEMNTAGQFEAIAKKYMPLEPRYIRLPAKPFQ